VIAVRGAMHFTLTVAPRFDYGRVGHGAERHAHGMLFRSPVCTLPLETDLDLELRSGDAHAEFTLHPGEALTVVST
jgi:hypothetical protein